MSFTNLGLSPALLKSVANQKWDEAYPIQQKAIPAILDKKDVLGIAETGSGKTASYVLPILMNLQRAQTTKNRLIQTLVLVPTRELAMQINEVFQTFIPALSKTKKTMAVYGGVSINPQMKALYGVDILIATPGRLLDLVDANAVHLTEVTTLILDEADKMLNLGFKDEMNRIFSLLPVKRQNLLFSATLSDDLNNFHQILLNKPVVFKVENKNLDLELINQLAYFVEDEKKGPLLRYLIRQNGLQQVLVFVSSVHRADNVVDKLRKNGIEAIAIHSKKSQNARIENLRKFKTGHLRVLVTTDLLSRGIDIEFLPHVINYELPRSPKDYIHRIGRTGRAESPGDAISFVNKNDEPHFRVIQKKMGKWVTMVDSKNIDLQGY